MISDDRRVGGSRGCAAVRRADVGVVAMTGRELRRAVLLGVWDTFVAWQKVEAVTFAGWAAYKTYRLFRPAKNEHGVPTLTPNTMKLWSQIAYVDNPAVAAAIWDQVPWTWEEAHD